MKNTECPNSPCDGKLTECISDYKAELPSGEVIGARNVRSFKCGKCSLEIYPPESSRKMDDVNSMRNFFSQRMEHRPVNI